MTEYKIQVSLTPHPWDDEDKPYFWCVLEYRNFEFWTNTGISGWAETPEEAFKEGFKRFQECLNGGLNYDDC